MLTHGCTTPVMPSRVAVLGATGAVGAALVQHLRDLEIETLALSSRDVDLCQPDAAARLQELIRPDDALVIVSAITPDKGRDAGTLMRNLRMGESLSQFLASRPCAHVVYISSDAVYGERDHLIHEGSPCDPASFHGLMHLVRERMLSQAVRSAGTPLAILRPCALFGPGDTHSSYGPNQFVRTALREGRIALFGDGEEQRDHVFLPDLSRLAGLCLLHRSAGVLNAATGASVSFHEVARLIAERCDRGVRIERLPRRAPVSHRHMDTAALIRAFPSFRFTPLTEALAACLGERRGIPAQGDALAGVKRS